MEKSIARDLKSAIESGFEPIGVEGQQILLVEYRIDGFGTPNDLEKRHKLEDRLNETLGWTGIGHADGGSIGSGTKAVACVVVDADAAKNTIESDLRNTPFGDYLRLYVEGTR